MRKISLRYSVQTHMIDLMKDILHMNVLMEIHTLYVMEMKDVGLDYTQTMRWMRMGIIEYLL